MIAPIIYASILTAIVIAPPIHLLGIGWGWSFLLAAAIASSLGWSAADALHLI